MRRYIIISILFLTGCSSSNKVSDSPAVEEAYQETSVQGEVKVEPAPKQVTSRTDATALEDIIKNGNDDQIYKTASFILAKNPNDSQALNAMGVVLYRRGQFTGALYMFDKSLRSNPRLVAARNNKATVYLAQKETRDAIKEYRKVLEHDPNNAIAAANLGSLYIESKDYSKAYVAMDIASKKFFRDPKIQNNYGIALAATGRYQEAKEAYLRALDKSPGNKDIMLNYAILLVDHLKQNKEGLDLINKIRFLGPSPEVKVRINTLENIAKAGIK